MSKMDVARASRNRPFETAAWTCRLPSFIPSSSLGRLLGVDALHFKLDGWVEAGLPDDCGVFRAERFRMLACKLAEECPGGVPDVVALASPRTVDAAALAKGFDMWQRAGLAATVPHVIHVIRDRRTCPRSDSHVPVTVTPRQAEAARTLLAAEEGLSVSSDAASAFAGLVRELRAGRIARRSRVVVLLT
jgi:hypothetical protein